MHLSAADPLQVAAYVRVSTDHEDQLHSLAAQRVFFENYISQQPLWKNAGIFADEGLSGTSTKRRPEFNHMLSLARAGKIDLILTKEVSRFARNTVDTLSVTRELKSLGVGVIFLNDNIDTRDNDGEFRLTIMASVAQEESRKISERTRWGQAQAMKRGVVFGNNSIFGYQLKDGILVVDPTQAEVVKLVYHKFLVEHKGTYVIAKELTKAGIFPPLRPGQAWSSTAILRILRNEKYTGTLLQKKYYTTDYLSHKKVLNDGTEPQLLLKDHHEAIVSQETFDAAQSELKRRHDLTKDKHCFSNRYWFSGKVRCGCCGSSFRARVEHRPSGQIYRWFACYGKTQKKTTCSMRGFNGQWLELCAKHVLSQLSLDHESIVAELLSDLRKLRQEESPVPDQQASIAQAIQRQQARRDRALEAYLDGTISKEDWQRQAARSETELKRLETQRSEAEQLQAVVQTSAARYREIQGLIEEELNGGPNVLDEVIERVVVEEDAFLFYIQDLPIYFRLTVESTGSGLSYTSSVTSCTPLPRETNAETGDQDL